MNQGMNPGFSLSTDTLSGNTIALEVLNLSGSFIPKSANFEITLIGGGSGGESNVAGGSSGASLIKRVIGAIPGAPWAVIVGAVGAIPRQAGGLSMVIPPADSGIQIMLAPGAGASSVAAAVATGGDINYAGQAGQGVYVGVGLGGMGGATPFSMGGVLQGGTGVATPGAGPGSGGSGADPGAAVGQAGRFIVRYF